MFSGKYEWAGDRASGDCSLRILDSGEVDDGKWECQVTASSFTAHDALSSEIALLVVRGNYFFNHNKIIKFKECVYNLL